MGTLQGLAVSMRELNAKLNGVANEGAKEATLAIVTDLTQTTPVDIGEALSNWQVSLESPDLNSITAFAPSPRGKMVKGVWTHTVPPEVTREANAPLTIAAAEAAIYSKQPGQPIFITNAQPHIETLDAGSSNQQPAGFVDRAVIIGRSIVDKIKVLV